MVRAESCTFTDRLRARVDARGDAEAYVFLRDQGAAGLAPEHLTYAALDEQARDIASLLRARGLAARQVLLLYPSGLPFVAAFAGCQYAGAVAVPAPLPAGRGQHFQRLSRIAADAEVGLVLTTSAHAALVESWLAEAEGLDGLTYVVTDEGPVGDAASWRAPELTPDALSFLQYTSGSTSEPKGVMVSHANLVAQGDALARSMGSDADSVFGSWLPMYHDMGLIGHVLQPLQLGARAALMAPGTFLSRPVRWLEMVTEHRVTDGGAPNFAYDACLRRIRDEELAGLDLSTWRAACNGAEPVRADTVTAFVARFGPVGFRPETFFPCYGMAEATLLVSGTPRESASVIRTVDARSLERGSLAAPSSGAATRELVSSGIVRAQDFEVRVVDPESRRPLADGRVGEIWLAGTSVCRGYWARAEQSAEVFGASLEGTGADRLWLRSGDLGAYVDGELFVTGRLKEMILINGRNVYPHDVEAVAREVDASLCTGAAFSVPGADGRERLVLVQEIKGSAADLDRAALVRRLQKAVNGEFGVPLGLVALVRPGTVRRTTSGKIQRRLMRTLYEEGSLPLLPGTLPAPSPSD
ncbi:fatty acyl-AMP ligase [Streptomyces sp. NPDC048172]|uniref:fatty acyl-AMP ligase n=1 Tax=Streptomyces sp. NPDC048172 TaxID=3365505 RepID=UPI003720EAF2